MKKQKRILATVALLSSLSILGYIADRYQKNHNESIISKINNLSSTSVQIAGCETPILSNNIIEVTRFGASGTDNLDDTLSIQNAIDSVQSIGTVIIPPGLYFIDATSGIKLKSNITLLNKGTLQALPNSLPNSRIIMIRDSKNVNIIGGELIGERESHIGTSGEWGMGIQIMSSSNILIKDVKSKNNWGDGFYIGRDELTDSLPKSIRFCSVSSTNNRRQGLSITTGDEVLVNNSVFSNTNGTPPAAGIDIEPDRNETISNVAIFNSLFYDNQGAGIVATMPLEYDPVESKAIQNVIIKNNIVSNNSCTEKCSDQGILLSNTSGNTIVNNIVTNNGQDGISLVNGSANNIVKGNISTNNGTPTDTRNGIGILLYYTGTINNSVTNNIVTGNTKANILDDNSGSNKLESNIEDAVIIPKAISSFIPNLKKREVIRQ